MLIQCLIHIYDYIISFLSPSSSMSIIKHKNSEEISECDIEIEETTLINKKSQKTSPKHNYNTHKSKISPIKSRSKTHIPFEKYPIYNCGYCQNSIRTPQHLFQDMVFCNIMCRTHYISQVQTMNNNILA